MRIDLKIPFLINTVLGCIIMFAGQVQAASGNLINASQGEECPAGQTESFVGFGSISAGQFIPGAPFDAIEACNDNSSASQIIRNHTIVSLRHVSFAASELWDMDSASSNNTMVTSSDGGSDLSFWGI